MILVLYDLAYGWFIENVDVGRSSHFGCSKCITKRQWLWLSWQSGHFQHQRSAVIGEVLFSCQLYWKYENNKNEAGNGPFKKRQDVYLRVAMAEQICNGHYTLKESCLLKPWYYFFNKQTPNQNFLIVLFFKTLRTL